MTFKFKHYDKIAGIFVLVGILALLFVVIMMLRGQKFFGNKLYLQTTFASGENLSKGMDVKINGIVVGKVSSVGFAPNDPDNKIDVRFFVHEAFMNMVNSECFALLEGASPLGGGHISLVRDKEKKNGVPLNNEDHILSQDSPGIKERVDRGEIQKSSGIGDILADVGKTFAQLSATEGPLIGTLKNLQQTTDNLVSGRGALGGLLVGDSTESQSLQQTLNNAKSLTENFTSFSAMLRSESPTIKKVLGSADQGLNEATHLLGDMQKFFGFDRYRPVTSGADGSTDTIQHIQRTGY